MLTNTPATLYNEYKNPDTGRTEYRRTVLAAVHWEDNKAANVLSSGLESADAVSLVIWFTVDAQGRRYLPPKQYAALPADQVDGYWTMWPAHDRIVKGVVDDGPVLESPAALTGYDTLTTIMKVDTMDYGNPHMYHWEVSGS